MPKDDKTTDLQALSTASNVQLLKDERDRLFLGHVLEAIAAIESFTVEGRASFLADLKTQSAVVRLRSSPRIRPTHRLA